MMPLHLQGLRVGDRIWRDRNEPVTVAAIDLRTDKYTVVPGHVSVATTAGAELTMQKPAEIHIDPVAVAALADLIRETDGQHTMGAAALAEALVARGVTLHRPGQ